MIRRGFLACLAFGLVGCSDFGPFDVNVDDIVGTYVLESIDGVALPVVWSLAGGSVLLEITAGHLTLNEDRTCSESRTSTRTEDGVVTTETAVNDGCTYRMYDSRSFFLNLDCCRRPVFGWIDGSTISITDDGEEAYGFYRK